MTADISARTHARNLLMARGFSEGEAVALLCSVIGEAYREVARESTEGPGDDWGATPDEAVRKFGASFAKSANDIDPQPTPARTEEEQRT